MSKYWAWGNKEYRNVWVPHEIMALGPFPFLTP